MSVVEIKTKAEFDKLVADKPYVALQASAAWCGPCKAISPLFAKHATGLTNDKYAFAKFDTDDVPDLAFELGIRSIPAFFFFENGDKAETVNGANPPALKKVVDAYSAKASGAAPAEAAAPAPTPAAVEPKADGALKTDEDF